MEKALAEGPGAFLCLLLLLPGAGRAVPLLRQGAASRGRAQKSGGPTGFEGGTARSTGAKAPARSGEAQVILPASSRSLQPSADTQQQRAGGGVRGREGKGKRKSRCCCRP